MRSDRDEVRHSLDTCQPMYSMFCISLLELEFDLAFERHPAFAHRHFYFVSGDGRIPLEGVEHSRGNVGVGAFAIGE